MQIAVGTIDTPLGRYVLAAGERGLVRASHEGWTAEPAARATAPDPAAQRVLDAARAAFAAYFAGSCAALQALSVEPSGSDFQRRVWRALREIPVGATATYAEIARAVGSPGAARAVGDANRRNPIAIAIPCHRVIGADGRLVGYAGGLERKSWLLAHESRWLDAHAASSKSNGPGSPPLRTVSRSRIRAAASI
jgi:methylated-DNA-[protein]-cysteine S-methyltransferase